jgi:hypothetical protein
MTADVFGPALTGDERLEMPCNIPGLKELSLLGMIGLTRPAALLDALAHRTRIRG